MRMTQATCIGSESATLHVVRDNQYDTAPTASLKSHLRFHLGNLPYALAFRVLSGSSSGLTLGQADQLKGINQDNFYNRIRPDNGLHSHFRRYAGRPEGRTGINGSFARPRLIWVVIGDQR